MATKTCVDCVTDRDEDEFPWKVSGVRRHPYCKPCGRARSRTHYRANRQARIGQVGARKQRLSEHRRAQLLENGRCCRCGTGDELGVHADGAGKQSLLQGSKARFDAAVAAGVFELRCRSCWTSDGMLTAAVAADADGESAAGVLCARMAQARVGVNELAAALGTDASVVSRWRHGRRNPKDLDAVLTVIDVLAIRRTLVAAG